jgi:hypothetical protein
LPSEKYDPNFAGQELETVYFDTQHFRLRKARHRKDKYLTLRIRCYGANDTYAISAKTESEKFRKELASPVAEGYLDAPESQAILSELPPNLQARALEILGDDGLQPVVKVCCRRYAVENATDRYTLDAGVETDLGKCLPYGVLEFKSTGPDAPPLARLSALKLRPTKLSKFLWATLA